YTWEMGRACDTGTMSMQRVEQDGRYWVRGASNVISVTPYFECMKTQTRAHPYLDWLKAQKREGSGPAPVGIGYDATPRSEQTTPPLDSAVMVPTWHVGDEWQFGYKSPSGSGTYVWVLARIEDLNGIPHYVIKSGTREIFYRVSDLAHSVERVDGVV